MTLSVPPASTQGIGDLLADAIGDDQLAKELGVTLQTVRKWVAAGKLPPRLNLPGRMPRRSRSAIKAMIAAGSTPPRRGRRP